MSSMSNTCPICSKQISGDVNRLQLHANRHLDAREEAASGKAALELNVAVNRGTQLSDEERAKLTPAERMVRDLEDSDAAFAAALVAAEGGPTGFMAPSLRGSLSDSAEHFYPNIMVKIFPRFDVLESMLRHKMHICSKLDLFSSNIAGLGWDCGFRNIQMLCSSLLSTKQYRRILSRAGIAEVPSVPEIAGRIEDAWRRGYDPEGAARYNGRLTDKEVWIGAAEVYILLRSLEIPTFVKDFETPNDHFKQKMYEWIFNHFESWCVGKVCPLHRGSIGSDRRPSFVPPLFCQWPGHSLTITGAEKTRNGEIVLIVLDPMRGFYHSVLQSRSSRFALVHRDLHHPQFAQPRFQLVSLTCDDADGTTPVQNRLRGLLSYIRLGGS